MKYIFYPLKMSIKDNFHISLVLKIYLPHILANVIIMKQNTILKQKGASQL